MQQFQKGLAAAGLSTGETAGRPCSLNRQMRTPRQRRKAYKKELKALLDQYQRKFAAAATDTVSPEQEAEVMRGVAKIAAKWGQDI